ncbi:MATE family efflux transporter [Nonomuraea sp. NPDC050404]|uniref:MATE family efflux transporter n=1 Tax=Nonomuraea sp. NPDC050404 TaxID=3155783 RepID=UPI0034065D03
MPSPHRVILSAAVPLMLSLSAGIIAQVTGTSLLGRHATADLAAFALLAAVMVPVNAAVAGAVRGMAPFVATCRDRPAEALPLLKDARWLSLAAGAVGAGVMLGVPLIARAGGVSGRVAAEFGVLPQLFALQVLLAAAGGGAGGMLIALGHSRRVLWPGLTGTALHVLLLVLLVPRLGVQGTGIAGLISTAVSVALSNLLLRRLPELAGRSLWPGRPRFREIARMARVGLPMSGTLIIKSAVMGTVTYAAAGGGAHAAAAHAILLSVEGPIGLIAFATGQAATPEIARSATRGEARRFIGAALTVAATGVSAGALLLLLLGEAVLRLFTTDARVLALTLGLLPLLAIYALTENCVIVMSACLMGLKRSGWILLSASVGHGALAVAVTPVTATWGLTGLWTALIVSRVLVLAMQTIGLLRHGAPPPGSR